MYINTDTSQYPISESEIRASHPDTSFPLPFTPPDGYAWVFSAPPPAFDFVTQMARQVAPELTALGHWEQRWEVVSRFTEYTDDQGVTHTVAEQEAAAIAASQAVNAQALQARIVAAAQERLDAFARERGYDDIKSASDYAGCSVPKFSTEGAYCRDARAETWEALYVMLDEVQAGTRPMPTSFADIEPELPPLVWPT
jgi:hypothetical protein